MKPFSIKITLFCIFLMSCGPSVRYTGKSYTPTKQVDIYSSVSDVKRSYEIMGKADGTAWLLTYDDKIKKSIVKEARKKGADGVIFTETGEELVSDSKDSVGITSNQHVRKLVRAEFIRYR